MVRRCLCLLIILFMHHPMIEAEPFVEAAIDSMNSQAHFPLEGTITITHEKSEKIDTTSFMMEGKPLKASFLKDVKMSATGDTLVTIYNFQLPAKDKGLYILPSITVKINGKSYQSVSSAYQVGEATSQPASTLTESKAPVIFKLEAAVQGKSTLYPGQRTKLFYRISYNRSVDLTRSTLPLVHPEHFIKVGDVLIKDYQHDDVTVQELTQEIEASKLGTFQLGPSLIQGYAYTIKNGQKVYEPNLLQSAAPLVTIEVKPFPLAKPASFTGAIGRIKATSALETASSALVGDNVRMKINVDGITNLAELRLPPLECQPGFSGFFHMSDLPALAEIKENTKIFHVELRPLNTLVNQIPSIELSSFDPERSDYVVQHLPPLPLKVEELTQERHYPIPLAILKSLPKVMQWPKPVVTPVEVQSAPVSLADLKPTWKLGSWILWLFPIGFLLLYLQRWWHEKWEKGRMQPQLADSEQLLQRALKSSSLKSREALHLLEQSFWHRLWEKGIVPVGEYNLSKIRENAKFEAIASFLLKLQASQYGSQVEVDPLQLKQYALQLFKNV